MFLQRGPAARAVSRALWTARSSATDSAVANLRRLHDPLCARFSGVPAGIWIARRYQAQAAPAVAAAPATAPAAEHCEKSHMTEELRREAKNARRLKHLQQQKTVPAGLQKQAAAVEHSEQQRQGLSADSARQATLLSAAQRVEGLPMAYSGAFRATIDGPTFAARFASLPYPVSSTNNGAAQQAAASESEATAAPSPAEDAAAAAATTVVGIAGRVVSVRDMGRVVFLTLRSNGAAVQVMANLAPSSFDAAALARLKEQLRIGDIVGATGTPTRTRKGELTVAATSVEVLVPYVCTDMTVVPDLTGHVPLADAEVKYRYRFIDMICNPATVDVFRTRHKVIRALRNFLDSQGFVEVETPMFHTIPGGASAKPFTTHHNANNADLFLRIAPELYLKQCVVGGMDRVYEIGKVFRNEDTDRSHNPEFTSCEFYMAYANYEDLIVMTQKLLQELCVCATGGSPTIVVRHCRTGEPVVVDFSKPYARLPVIPTLEARTGLTFPSPEELDTPLGVAFLGSLLQKHKIPLPTPRTPAKLLDKLIDHFITDDAVQPTFVTDHPTFMSPLARSHATNPGLTERFELFVNGMEVCNSYSELTDPREQLRRFEQQMKDRDLGDDEAQTVDETFLKALQTGLPPTAGWGMGIDRIVMLLCGGASIRDAIIFPLLRNDECSHDTKRRAKAASFFGFNQQMTLFCLSALEAELKKRGEARGGSELRHLRSLIFSLCKNRRDGGAGSSGGASEPPCAEVATCLLSLVAHLFFGGPPKK